MYLATYEESYGMGKTLNEAYKDLQDNCDDNIDIDYCLFYEAKEIKVVHEIKAVQVTTVRKATTTNEKGNTCKSK